MPAMCSLPWQRQPPDEWLPSRGVPRLLEPRSTLPSSSHVRSARASLKPGCASKRSHSSSLSSPPCAIRVSLRCARESLVVRGLSGATASASPSHGGRPVAPPTDRRAVRGCVPPALRDDRHGRHVEVLALYVQHEVTNVVEERGDQERVLRAATTCERGALQRMSFCVISSP